MKTIFNIGTNYVYIFLLLSVAIMSCTSQKKETIMVSGSTTVLPVVSKAAEQFRLRYPDVNIVVNAGGSGVGINLLGERQIQIGMASRNITRNEIEKYADVHFVTHPIGKDAVAPVVSSEIYDARVKALTIAQIAGIYKGEIRNWSEVGGPDREILVVDKEKSRGTRHVFMKIIMGDKEAEAPGADLVLGSNNEEQTAIAQSGSAIGMLSNAWLNSDVKGLSIILNDGETIAPTLENIINGKFPITRELLLITDGKPQGKTEEFIDFIKSPDGQKIVEQAGYVSLYE
ncbi:MAG: phosphate ABC transporter substrate-binding protein [Candidatus Scalindua sp.]|nr:phosphate ABC transporter substrate-binding protein [Candidatus Scalindua sp.]MCR4345543.1 phosphate ABC transporter substrate-binding protein [Candidatus Scalindua sp.]